MTVRDRIGPFTFPAPYQTQAIRLTDAENAPRGVHPDQPYSYWSMVNNHRGAPVLYVIVGRVGARPLLLTIDKTSLTTVNEEVLGEGTAEGWYFSDTRPHALYMLAGAELRRLDVVTKQEEVVFTLDSRYGDVLWQAHSSGDDAVHSATVERRVAEGAYPKLGTVVWRLGWQRFIPATGAIDESQVDKSGRYLVIQQDKDNLIYDLDLAPSVPPRRLSDSDGAVGHCDVGYGELVGEDDRHEPGALVLWSLTDPSAPRRLLYQTHWGPGMGHVAWRRDFALLSSNASDELILVPADGSQHGRLIAPGLMVGDGSYGVQLRANLDPLGEWACYATNCGVAGGPLHAFLVRVTDGGGPAPDRPNPPQPPPPGPGGSMKPLIIFTTPLDMEVELAHDQNNFSVKGVPGTDEQGRAGHDLVLDESLPEGNGARIFVRHEGRTVYEQRGRLWLKERTDAAGRKITLARPEFVGDDYIKPEGF